MKNEKQATRQLHALTKINNITGYLPLNINQMLKAITKEIDEIFSPFRCSIKLLGEESNHDCRLIFSKDCKALRDQLPMLIDKGSKPCCNQITCKKKYNNQPVLKHVCIPLISGTEAFGVITLKGSNHEMFSRDSMELLLAIANQVSATMQRAKLFDHLAEEKKNLEHANRDITKLNQDLRETISELKKAQMQLVNSEKLAAAGKLAANITHEINNPTGIILSRLEWLLMENQHLSQDVVEDLLIIKKHTERIAQITRGLLSFSRESNRKYFYQDLSIIIRNTIDWLERHFNKKNIEIKLNISPLPDILCNLEQIEQVFVNLLTNAVDAMPQGGLITINAWHKLQERVVQIDIIDTGSGIENEVINKVFDPFFTTKDKELGTGLGLPVSQVIIKEHGGYLKVRSRIGEGSCFSIILPDEFNGKDGVCL